jgi:hypothetical protein
MAGSFSTALKNKLIDHVMKGTAYTQPTNIYIGLTTSANTDATPGTEVTGGSYGRIQVNSGWSAAAAGTTDCDNDITFATATADWGTVTGAIVMDAITSGNYLGWCTLTASKTVNNGDTFKFAAGEFDVSFSITP